MTGPFLAALILAAGTGISEYVPDPVAFVERPRLGKTGVAVALPGGGLVRPASLTTRLSLAGEWAFKGLDRRREPFGPMTEAETALMQPGHDESGWTTIRVPLNWWEDRRFAYDTCYEPNEPCFRGYYRRRFDVANPKDGRSRWLRFEEVGAEFDLFVNGRHVAHHLGDFTPVEVDVTDALVPGSNLVALRVLADFGPAKGKPYARIYGAHWDHKSVRGGIWHTVELVEAPAVRITEMLIDPRDNASGAGIRCRVDNRGPRVRLGLFGALVEDRAGASAAAATALGPVTVESGTHELAFDLSAADAKRWSPADPNLYWATAVLADESNRVVAAGLDRFGFRTMRIDGTRFRLNGDLVYLVGDSLHSLVFGGRREDAVAKLRRQIAQHKRNGANLLRTAHMPAIPEVCAFADEIGMMIYDEWGNSFCNDIDEEPFEKNNLPELEKWVRRDYNHASVVLWSLGNEVRHIRRADICRQLDLQYDLVKRLDRQRRPASTFSGGADVWAYGDERLKTDFLDTHRYLGIDATSWTTWFGEAERWYPQVVATYGENGRLTLPLVMWECVGAGWGLRRDDALQAGDVGGYLRWAAKPCSWNGAEGIAFTGSVGLLPLLHNHRHYVQRYLADRLCELFVQDRRLAGFAPWFADPTVPGATRWFQPVYPLLRNNSAVDGRIMFRQLPSPGERTVECAVVNHSPRRVDAATVAISLAVGGAERPLDVCRLRGIEPFEEKSVRLTLKVPAGLSGPGEIRLTLSGAGVEGRNSYAVSLHDAARPPEPLPNGVALVLATASPLVETALRTFGVDGRPVAKGAEPSLDDVLLVPPEGSSLSDARLSAWIVRGGTALVLEPDGLSVPGCPQMMMIAATNHQVELVVPDHPAFAGLGQVDFDTWAENPFGAVACRGIAPLTEGVLAAKGRYIRDVPSACALSEHAYGKGRLVVSSVAALEAFGRNPAATRYVENLLRYVLDARRRVPSGKLPLVDDVVSRPLPADVSPNPLVIVPTNRPERLSFRAASTPRDAPWKIFFFTDRKRQLAERGYRYLTVRFKSRDVGRVDLTIPRQDHRNRLTYTLPTSLSDGAPVTLRLDLRKDFRFAREGSFGLDEARGEIILYNGYEADRGLPRPPVALEILEMKFE